MTEAGAEHDNIIVRDRDGKIVRIFRMVGRGSNARKVCVYDPAQGIDRREEFGVAK